MIARESDLQKGRIKIICELAGSGKSILNIGCPKDRYLNERLKENNNRSVTVDLYEDADIKADLNDGLPAEPGSYECIVAAEIIEHLLDTRKILTEIHSVLTDNGELILSVPNMCSLRNRLCVLLGEPNVWARWRLGDEVGGHVATFTFKYMKELLEENGFQVIEETTSGVYIKNRFIIPHSICKHMPSLGEHIIIKAEKITY